MVNIKLNYNFVETPRKFMIAKLSIRKLGSSSVLMILLLTDRKPCDNKLNVVFSQNCILIRLKFSSALKFLR